MAKKIETVRDARLEKLAADDKLFARDAKRNAKHVIPANLHPAIGVLQSARGVRFYAYVNGFYYEGSVAALTAKLEGGR